MHRKYRPGERWLVSPIEDLVHLFHLGGVREAHNIQRRSLLTLTAAQQRALKLGDDVLEGHGSTSSSDLGYGTVLYTVYG